MVSGGLLRAAQPGDRSLAQPGSSAARRSLHRRRWRTPSTWRLPTSSCWGRPPATSSSQAGPISIERSTTQCWYSRKLTLVFVLVSGVVAQTVIGLILALLAQRAHLVVRASVGAIVVLAWVIPEIAVAFMWYAFAQGNGLLSTLLGRPSDDLLAYSAFVVVCAANAWRGTAFSMLILSAGLRNVPAEVEEAARLEGASYWRRLTRVTLPMIRPTLMTNLILVTLGTLSDFTLVYAMTNGGPGNSTSILPVYMYVQGFTFNQLGYVRPWRSFSC